MRKALTFAVTVAVVAIAAMPLTLVAQSASTAGTVAGRSVDAMGRGMFGERVELVRDTQVLAAVTTNGLGEWTFPRVEPGVYIVRMNVRGRIAGVRVTVAAGQVINGTMIVVPAATASLQLGALANLITLLPAATATAVQTAASVVQDVDTTNLSPAAVQQIIQNLPAAERVAFANAVLAALPTGSNPSPNANPFANAVQQLNTIVSSNGATVPTFPPPTSVS